MVKDFDDLDAIFANIREQVGSGRKMIYAALADTYDLLCSARADNTFRKRLSKHHAQKFGKPQKNTDFPAIVARLAIDDDPKTSNPYAANFRAALEQDISAEDYPAWLDKHGIYLMKPKSGKSVPARSEDMAEKGVEAAAKAPAKATFDLPDGVRPESNVAILIIRQRTIGEASASIIDVIDDYEDAALRGILEKYAKSENA